LHSKNTEFFSETSDFNRGKAMVLRRAEALKTAVKAGFILIGELTNSVHNNRPSLLQIAYKSLILQKAS
jgi:hypothetical protein